jgi:hypothetical protein
MGHYEIPGHTVKVKWQHAWNEWLASCSCGWVGDYVMAEETSKRNAREHLEQVAAAPSRESAGS